MHKPMGINIPDQFQQQIQMYNIDFKRVMFYVFV